MRVAFAIQVTNDWRYFSDRPRKVTESLGGSTSTLYDNVDGYNRRWVRKTGEERCGLARERHYTVRFGPTVSHDR